MACHLTVLILLSMPHCITVLCLVIVLCLMTVLCVLNMLFLLSVLCCMALIMPPLCAMLSPCAIHIERLQLRYLFPPCRRFRGPWYFLLSVLQSIAGLIVVLLPRAAAGACFVTLMLSHRFESLTYQVSLRA